MQHGVAPRMSELDWTASSNAGWLVRWRCFAVAGVYWLARWLCCVVAGVGWLARWQWVECIGQATVGCAALLFSLELSQLVVVS